MVSEFPNPNNEGSSLTFFFQAVVSKKFRFYLFMMQMMQLPMIAMGRLPLLRKNPTLGNIFFWAGLIWGFPLLAVGWVNHCTLNKEAI